MTLIDQLLIEQGYVCLTQHPDLKYAVQRGRRSGRLRRLLPGIWTSTDPPVPPLLVRLRAVSDFDPNAVVAGWAAGWLLLGLPELNAPIPVQTTGRGRAVRHRPDRQYDFVQVRAPESFVMQMNGVRCTDSAMTAVDLAATDGGAAIDAALRLRSTSLDSLHWALQATVGRRGNTGRRRVLIDSRDEPWSAAERLAHRILRRAGIGGWGTNLPIKVADRCFFGDIVFVGHKLLLEIDGWAHHSGPSAFQTDRTRQNLLINAGWRVLRFTWADLTERPDEFVATVRAGMDHRHGHRSPKLTAPSDP